LASDWLDADCGGGNDFGRRPAPCGATIDPQEEERGPSTERDCAGRVKAGVGLSLGIAQQPPRCEGAKHTQWRLNQEDHAPANQLDQRHTSDHSDHRRSCSDETPHT